LQEATSNSGTLCVRKRRQTEKVRDVDTNMLRTLTSWSSHVSVICHEDQLVKVLNRFASTSPLSTALLKNLDRGGNVADGGPEVIETRSHFRYLQQREGSEGNEERSRTLSDTSLSCSLCGRHGSAEREVLDRLLLHQLQQAQPQRVSL
jgi:hypothetical protein